MSGPLRFVSHVIVIVLAGTIMSCSEKEHQTGLTDAAGRNVTLPADVQRIVTMAPGVTEIVFAAGAMDKVVGVTNVDNYPPDVADLPTFAAFPSVDYERIVQFRPDLVLAALQVNSPDNASSLEALGIPVVFLASSSVQEILDSIRLVGKVAGTAAFADSVVKSIQQRIDSLRSLTADVEHRPATIFLVSDVTPYSFGPESYIHDLIEWAGGTSLTKDAKTQAPVLSDEFMVSSGAEVIVGSFGEDYDPSSLRENHPVWTRIPAVQQGRVYSIDADITIRAGPRVVDGAWQLARLLHPSLLAADSTGRMP